MRRGSRHLSRRICVSARLCEVRTMLRRRVKRFRAIRRAVSGVPAGPLGMRRARLAFAHYREKRLFYKSSIAGSADINSQSETIALFPHF
jgi:hypothetical protein